MNFLLAASAIFILSNGVNASRDLLVIYNTNSPDSVVVKDYYLAHRPLVSGANVLGIGCPAAEIVSRTDYTNTIRQPILDWLEANPTKHPRYWVLFLDVPSRINAITNGYHAPSDNSVGYELFSTMPDRPLVTAINMNGTNDCKGYIDKLEFIGTNYSPGEVVLHASMGGYGNTNFVVDGIRHGNPETGDNFAGYGHLVSPVTNALEAAGIPASQIFFYDGLETVTNKVVYNLPHATGVSNVAGYISWGVHSSLGGNYALNGVVAWKGHSGWWIIETIESLNGMRGDLGHGNFIKWFSPDAFGGTNYSNTPVGAVGYTDEPGVGGLNDAAIYFGAWARGDTFANAAWESRKTMHFQAVGDPLVAK